MNGPRRPVLGGASLRRAKTTSIVAVMLALAACADQQGGPSGSTLQQQAPLVDGADGYASDFGIHCELSGADNGFGAVVTMKLDNRGTGDVELVKRGTPWENGEPVFRISSMGEEAEYIGKRSHFGSELQEADLMRLPKGDSTSIDYDLIDTVAIDTDGTYEVALLKSTLTLRIDGEMMNLQHDCQAMAMDIAAEPAVGVTRAAISDEGSCSDSQKDQLNRIRAAAHHAIHEAGLLATSGNGTREEWFGSWSSSRGTELSGELAAIESGLDDVSNSSSSGRYISCENPNNDCGSANAFVWPGKYGDHVFLCPPYWNLNVLSIEDGSSQAPVLIHELSHIDANTADTVYGADPARNLADTDPDGALDCAENYEHFGGATLVSKIVASTLFI